LSSAQEVLLSVERLDYQDLMEDITPESMAGGSVFGALSREASRFLLEQGILYQVKAGETVFEVGDPGERFFVVCEGSLNFYRQRAGELVHIRVIKFGEETGFVPMIALHRQTGSAIAREDSLVLEIGAALYAQLQQSYPLDFGLLTLNLAREMARVIDKLGDALLQRS
jgi:CRP-like cAMP-binding protein